MTYCGPYSQATLLCDASIDVPLCVVAPNGSVLSVLAVEYPRFFQRVKLAGIMPLYAVDNGDDASSTTRHDNVTAFVSTGDRQAPVCGVVRSRTGGVPVFSCTTKNVNYDYCKACTVVGRLNRATLESSPTFTLRTMSPANDLIVRNAPQRVVVADGCVSAIESSAATTTVNGSVVERYVDCTNGTVVVTKGSVWPIADF